MGKIMMNGEVYGGGSADDIDGASQIRYTTFNAHNYEWNMQKSTSGVYYCNLISLDEIIVNTNHTLAEYNVLGILQMSWDSLSGIPIPYINSSNVLSVMANEPIETPHTCVWRIVYRI